MPMPIISIAKSTTLDQTCPQPQGVQAPCGETTKMPGTISPTRRVIERLVEIVLRAKPSQRQG